MITNTARPDHEFCAKGGHHMSPSRHKLVCVDHQGPGGFTHCVRCGGDILKDGDGFPWTPEHGKCTLGHEKCYVHNICPNT